MFWPSGEGCRAAALQGSHWCYFHARMHSRQAQRHAERDLLQSIRRETARRQHRQLNGRFAPALAIPSHPSLDARPGQSPHPQTLTELSSRPERSEVGGSALGLATETGTDETGTETYDYGAFPVDSDHREQLNAHGSASAEAASLDLPPIEDTASIQLALIEVLQALAANQLDTKRAGLLLYGLQVASANAKHCKIPSHGVRFITHTDDGIPLAPQEYGYDLEDIEEEIRRDEEGEDEEVDEELEENNSEEK